MTTEKIQIDSNVHTQSGMGVDMIMKTALARRALDNITTVFIGLESWEQSINKSIEKLNSRLKEKMTNAPLNAAILGQKAHTNTSNDLSIHNRGQNKYFSQTNTNDFRSVSSGKYKLAY